MSTTTEKKMNDGGPAFPCTTGSDGGVAFYGMSKRELFAALAMQAFITSAMQPNVAAFLQAHNLLGPTPQAKAAVKCADALLAELGKGQQ